MMSEYLTCPEYEQLKHAYIRGWKTWNVHSVFSYVHMPDGAALNLCFKEYRDGNFLRDALIGRFPTDDPEDSTEVLFPGDHAPDDSYTCMKMQWCDMEILVESAAAEDAFALRVTPLTRQEQPARVFLQGGYLWNREGCVSRKAAARMALSMKGGERTWLVQCAVADTDPDRNVPLTGPYLSAKLEGPVLFYASLVAQSDKADPEGKSVSGIRVHPSDPGVAAEQLIETQKARLMSSFESAGERAWMKRAISCALTWDTVYDANRNRVISPVSRLWSIRKGGYVLFCWDNFFAGYLAGTFSKALAYSNVIEIVNERTGRGFIPNMACGNGMKTEDRSQPPVGSRMVLELYHTYGDLWLVKLLYPALLSWNTWFFENRRSASGAFCWGSDSVPVRFGNRWEKDGVYDRFGGALESGLDNSPMYDDIPFDPETHCLMLEDVGLTGLIIMDCASLGELAALLGKEADAKLLRERQEETQRALEQLWDEENGFYYNRRTDTKTFSRRISPTNFYALFSERIPRDRLERILQEHYYNSEEFYGDWMLPSIARNDPAFSDQDYWRGRVWAPMNFLVYLAFKQQHLTEACQDLAEKSEAIFRPEWEERRHVHENYNAITGEGCDARNSDRFYHWGALLPAIVLLQADR